MRMLLLYLAKQLTIVSLVIIVTIGCSQPLIATPLQAVMPPTPTHPVMTPQAALERLITADSISPDWFAPSFLAQVSVLQVQSILISLTTELGTYQKVEPSGNDYQVVYDKGIVPALISLNGKGQITGLRFQSPRIKLKTLEDAIAQFKQLPGKVSVLIQESNPAETKVIKKAALNETAPLAVGSAFKLAVLAALNAQIQSGQHRWDEVIPLEASQKSLPSGILQAWADGSLLTTQSLAALMISQSDNTATDHLMHLVGRSEIEALTPRNRPFLTTREFFILKGEKNRELLQRYRSANSSTRRTLLTEVAQLGLPNVREFEGDPVAIDIEWFFTAEELCSLMGTVRDLPLMSINPGVAKLDDWAHTAFKGGSEPGVLNLTTALQAKNGKQYCVVATWNHDQVLDESRFFSLYASTIELLK